MIKNIIKVVLVICVVLFASCSTKKEVIKKTTSTTRSTSDYYITAMEYAAAFEKSGFLDMDKYRLAEELFNRVVYVEKGDSDVWFNMGRLFFYAGEYNKARESFKEAIKYRKSFVEAYSMLAKTYLVDGSKESALGVMLKANESIPNNEVLMNNTSLVYIEMGSLNNAKKLSEKIIKNNPKFIPAYITLGNVYYIQKKYEKARFIYLKALDEGGDSGEIYTNIGLVTSKIEGKNQSYDLLKKGRDKSPNNPYARLNLGEFYLSSGDYENAITEFKVAIKLNPRLVEALVNIGVAYTQVGMFDEAKESYERAILYNPSYPESYFNYGILLGDYMLNAKDALGMFKKFVAIKSGQIKDNHVVYKYISDLNKKVKVN